MLFDSLPPEVIALFPFWLFRLVFLLLIFVAISVPMFVIPSRFGALVGFITGGVICGMGVFLGITTLWVSVSGMVVFWLFGLVAIKILGSEENRVDPTEAET